MPATKTVSVGRITAANAKKLSASCASYVNDRLVNQYQGTHYANLELVKRGQLVLTCEPCFAVSPADRFKVVKITSVGTCPHTGDPKVRATDGEMSWRIQDCAII